MLTLSQYRCRLEDLDSDIGPLFQEPNDQYRQKFKPKNLRPEFEAAEKKRLEEMQRYREGRRFNKKKKEDLLKNFNKRYKGHYEELEQKFYRLREIAQPDDKFVYRIDEQFAAQREADLARKKQRIEEQQWIERQDKIVNLNYRVGEGSFQPNLKNQARNGKQFPEKPWLKGKGNNARSLASFKRPVQGGKPTGMVRRTLNDPGSRFGSLPSLHKPQQPVQPELIPPPNPDDPFMIPCPLGCGRSFGKDAIDKHKEICQKVFTGRRDVYDSKKKRLNKLAVKLKKFGEE